VRDPEKFLGVWLSEAGRDAIAEQAKAAGVSKSEVVRRMLAFAARKMPKGWKP
jgi:hypothetical protein